MEKAICQRLQNTGMGMVCPKMRKISCSFLGSTTDLFCCFKSLNFLVLFLSKICGCLELGASYNTRFSCQQRKELVGIHSGGAAGVS